MMKLITAVLLASTASAVLKMDRVFNMLNAATATITICSGPNAHAKNLVVTLDPSSPVSNQNMTTKFEYDLDKEVTAGKAKYAASLNGLPFSSTDDLCADQAGSSDPCPLAVGHHVDTSVSEFPSFSGKLSSTITWTDQDGEEILCINMVFKQ